MKIVYHVTFEKHFKTRISPYPKLVSKFKDRLNTRINNPTDPVLKDHRLAGKRSEYRSFSVTGDVRVIYQVKGETLWLYDIGTHNQVY